ncbi:Putative protein of unknown function [Podospora comata]|uniref:NAD(P)-binding domain-containing protein n=1 Tax=Podospora comata TaxID=48703 RepID=A0ABY6RYY8_PODCO|nr:Putative protein of unknown function [Podospora comata]
MSKPWILLTPSTRGISHSLLHHLLRTTPSTIPILATTRSPNLPPSYPESDRLHVVNLDVKDESAIQSAAEKARELFPPKTHHLHLALTLPGILLTPPREIHLPNHRAQPPRNAEGKHPRPSPLNEALRPFSPKEIRPSRAHRRSTPPRHLVVCLGASRQHDRQPPRRLVLLPSFQISPQLGRQNPRPRAPAKVSLQMHSGRLPPRHRQDRPLPRILVRRPRSKPLLPRRRSRKALERDHFLKPITARQNLGLERRGGAPLMCGSKSRYALIETKTA